MDDCQACQPTIMGGGAGKMGKVAKNEVFLAIGSPWLSMGQGGRKWLKRLKMLLFKGF
jgi:hypothetical protein